MKKIYEGAIEWFGWAWDWITLNKFVESIKTRGEDFWSDEDGISIEFVPVPDDGVEDHLW